MMFFKYSKKHIPLVSVAVCVLLIISFVSKKNYHNLAMEYAAAKIRTPYTTMSYEDKDFGFRKAEFVKTGGMKRANNRGVQHFEDDRSVLVVSTVADKNSYGTGRSIQDLVNVMMSLDHNPETMTLAFQIADRDEYDHVFSFFQKYTVSQKIKQKPVARIVLLSAPFIDSEFHSINRENRHEDNIQRQRRRLIARSRNFALLNSLQNEQYTFFIDSDIEKIGNRDMLRLFIESKKDIIVPRIVKGDNEDYDKNSWAGTRTTPTEEQLHVMDINDWEKWDYVPRDVPEKMFHFQKFVDETRNLAKTDKKKQPKHIVELDSVGGAIIFAKSIIYRQGILFPPINIVGTTWERHEGFDGIETEGLCYLARPMGYKCWGMPNLVAYHNNS